MPITKLSVKEGNIFIEGPASAETISQKKISEELTVFRAPEEQKKALQKIAELPEGMVYIAHINDEIIGYVTFHHPEPFERWGEKKIDRLIELGAIEVAPSWRNKRIGTNLLLLAFSNPIVEDYIVISTEYYWHWDLEGTGLNIWEYKNMIECALKNVGFQIVSTDEPEINSHPANSLMVRYGENVSKDAIMEFESLRFKYQKLL